MCAELSNELESVFQLVSTGNTTYSLVSRCMMSYEEEVEDEGYYSGEKNVGQFQFYEHHEESELMVGKAVCLFLTCIAFLPPQFPFNRFPNENHFAEVQISGNPDCEKWKSGMQM